MSTFKDLYDTAKEAEDFAFAISPILLDFLKKWDSKRRRAIKSMTTILSYPLLLSLIPNMQNTLSSIWHIKSSQRKVPQN